jgi:hypothetical protein
VTDLQELPIAIYPSREAAREAERAARDEVASVLKKHGVLAAIIVLGMAHRDGDDTRMNVGIEGYGSTTHAHQIAADVCRPGLFS